MKVTKMADRVAKFRPLINVVVELQGNKIRANGLTKGQARSLVAAIRRNRKKLENLLKENAELHAASEKLYRQYVRAAGRETKKFMEFTSLLPHFSSLTPKGEK